VIRLAFVVMMVLTSLVAQKCDLAPSDLDIFISSNQVLVKNLGNTTAAVTVMVGGKYQSATLEPGGRLSVRSFEGGDWKVTVFAAASKRDYFYATIGNLNTSLNSSSEDVTDADREGTANEIAAFEEQLKAIPEGAIPGGTSCKGRFSMKGSSSLEIWLTQTEQTGDWQCE
jgi:hypothetical protein